MNTDAKEETVIKNPTAKVLNFMNKLRERKQRLRNELKSMKSEEFDVRVYLK